MTTLRPMTPPWALMSSAASCAPWLIDWPTIADSSLMTPILIGPLPAARAGGATPRAPSDRASAVVAPTIKRFPNRWDMDLASLREWPLGPVLAQSPRVLSRSALLAGPIWRSGAVPCQGVPRIVQGAPGVSQRLRSGSGRPATKPAWPGACRGGADPLKPPVGRQPAGKPFGGHAGGRGGMADTPDLGSGGASRGGSNPPARTTFRPTFA